MPGSALKKVLLCLLCGMLLLAACTPSTQEKENQLGSDETKQSGKEKLPRPPMILEEILAHNETGKYAGDNYDENKVQKALREMPQDLSSEETYAYLLNLVGESYGQYKEVFDTLENPNYRQDPLQVDPNAPKQQGKLNVEVLLDASGSMAARAQGGIKMDLAKQAIHSFVRGLPKEATISLRVFGHKGSGSNKDKALSCGGIEKVYGPAPYDSASFDTSLKRFSPRGWTPIANSLKAAQKDLAKQNQENNTNIIYLVSDGMETCGGDPVKVAHSLHNSDIKAVINIIGFDVNDKEQRQLKQVAEAGGGKYVSAKDHNELKQAFLEELEELFKENIEWGKRSHEKITDSHKSDDQLLYDTNREMFDDSMTEMDRLKKANAFLRDELNYSSSAEIDQWITNRWKLLKDYREESYQRIHKKIIDEWNDSHDEVHKQRKENQDKILEKKKSIND